MNVLVCKHNFHNQIIFNTRHNLYRQFTNIMMYTIYVFLICYITDGRNCFYSHNLNTIQSQLQSSNHNNIDINSSNNMSHNNNTHNNNVITTTGNSIHKRNIQRRAINADSQSSKPVKLSDFLFSKLDSNHNNNSNTHNNSGTMQHNYHDNNHYDYNHSFSYDNSNQHSSYDNTQYMHDNNVLSHTTQHNSPQHHAYSSPHTDTHTSTIAYTLAPNVANVR